MNTNYSKLVLRKPDPPSSFQTPYKESSQGSVSKDVRAPMFISLPAFSLSTKARTVPKFQTPSQSGISSSVKKRPSSEDLEQESTPVPKSFKSDSGDKDILNRNETGETDTSNCVDIDDSVITLEESPPHSKSSQGGENDIDSDTKIGKKKEETENSNDLGNNASVTIFEKSGAKVNTSDMVTQDKNLRENLGNTTEEHKYDFKETDSFRRLVVEQNDDRKDSPMQVSTPSIELRQESDLSKEDENPNNPATSITTSGGGINTNSMMSKDSVEVRLTPERDLLNDDDEFDVTGNEDGSKGPATNSDERGREISPGWEMSVFNLSLEDIVSDYGEVSSQRDISSSDLSLNILSRKFDKLASESNTDEIRPEEMDTIKDDRVSDAGSVDFANGTDSRAEPITSWFGSSGPLPQSPTSSVKSFNISNISFDEYRQSFRSYSQALWNPRKGSKSVSGITDHSASREQEGDSVIRQDEKLVSVFYNSSGLGAAVYHTESAKLELLRDVPDNCEEFEMLSMLFYQTEPDKILMSARQDQDTIKFVKELFSDQTTVCDDQSFLTNPESAASLGSSQKIVLRPSREFSLKHCERRLRSISIPGKKPKSEQERDILLSAFIDFSCDNMVRAAGALLNYVDKNYRIVSGDEPDVLFLGPLNLHPILSLDTATLTSLQVFSTSSQLSGSTAGSWNKRREGLSVFTLLNKCSSVVGSRFLRQMLRCPSGEKEVIERRQHDLEFFCNTAHSSFTQALCESVKKIKNFQRLMKKLSSNTMTKSDWLAIARTLNGIVEIAIHSENCKEEVYVLQNILRYVSDKTYNLRKIFEDIIDFKNSQSEGPLRVNPGVDAKLDEKRRLLNGLSDLMNKVVLEEAPKMPEFMNVFTFCYLPHVGYLIAVSSSQQLKENVDYKNLPDLEFVFESNNTIHFRNAKTRMLDTTWGDVHQDIIKIETIYITRLSEALLKQRNSLENIVTFCAHLDCLLALSHVCRERNWVKPEITVGGDISITDGRHPLQETTLNNFIANDTDMGSQGGRVHFLTGPNSSGKSVYMKQVGLIVFLAHLGCFVPASSASIPVLDRINTRITTTESISTGMSSFMCDINQLTFSLTHLRPRSLFLVDEFGKGTSAQDGASLLAATVSILADMDQGAPFSIFSSHFHSVPPLVDSDPQPRFLHMKTEVREDDLLYYFKLTDGISKFSHATKVARMAGLDNNVLVRAEGILNCIINGDEIVEDRDLVNRNRISDTISHLLDMDPEREEQVDIFLQMVKDLYI